MADNTAHDKIKSRTKLPSKPTYRPSPTRRSRRTKSDVKSLELAIYSLLRFEHPMTLRQLFYRLVSAGEIEKSEREYKAIGHRLTLMRRSGAVPYSWMADSTRWMRKPETYTGVEHALEQTARYYRRALWHDQEAYVEVWCEKEALAGVLVEETDRYDVPLMVTRGYPSLTYLYSAAETISYQDRPAYLYYFGDHDPSGVDIPKMVHGNIREMAPDAEIHFQRVAVNVEQIAGLGLPTRPTKKTDTRAKTFKGESVEVDAIPPLVLREMVRDCIEQHLPTDALAINEAAEESERAILRRLAGMAGDGA